MDQNSLDTSVKEQSHTTRVSHVPPVARGPRSIAQQFFGRILPRSAQDIESDTLTIRQTVPKGRGYLLSFILLVIVPSIAAVVYLAFLASDQYDAEARFAVRTAQNDSSSLKSLTAMTSSASSGAISIPPLAGQDPYIVTSYLHSRAVIDDLSKSLDLRAIFRRPEADFWARLKRDASAEDLVAYWNGMVTTYVDGPSAIVTVKVRTFRPDDSLALLHAILKASEALVNEVSARARNDAMKRAEGEVRRYENQVRSALVDLRKFRDSEGIISPVESATSTSKLLLALLSEKIRAQSELFVALRALSADAPTVRTLKVQVESLDKQIDEMKSKLTGNTPESRTISSSLVKFEELELKRIFAEKLYTMAQNALERARVRAEQQNIYISVFVPPALPEDAENPKRVALSFLIPIILLVIWGILALTAAAVEDHRL